jgi:hypothetical protein
MGSRRHSIIANRSANVFNLSLTLITKEKSAPHLSPDKLLEILWMARDCMFAREVSL